MKRWVEARKGADFAVIAKKYNISPLLARIIRNRDVCGDDAIDFFLNGRVKDMHSPSLFADIDKAAARIMQGVVDGERIRIIGDYDIDGVCATYILKKSLTLMGAKVDALLPDRITDGYGLNKNLIDVCQKDGVSLIVTCDNGIAAREEISYAALLGIDVVVTDHHEVPFEDADGDKHYLLPEAVAVVDPKRADCRYPYKGICGGMVAYKMIVYITTESRYADAPEYAAYLSGIDGEVLDELLTFAAFATVGDVMELLDENRIAVRRGLELMSHPANTGLRALIEVCGIDKEYISVYHIGFILGPCLNATGRLDSAHRALELFECTDYEKAVLIARDLKELNENRKNMTINFTKEAADMAAKCDDKVLVLYLPDCHESLAGIVAGRIREQFYKPTIVLTDASEGVKGSGRSIDDYSMFEELVKVGDIFTKFGGHKLAAGVSLPAEKITELRRRLNENTTLSDEQLIEKQTIDIVMPMNYATLELAREIDELAPFGVGNPKPNFASRNVKVESKKLIGKNQNVLKLKLSTTTEDGRNFCADGIMFDNAAEVFDSLSENDVISILYQIDINSYMGRDSVQLVVKDIK